MRFIINSILPIVLTLLFLGACTDSHETEESSLPQVPFSFDYTQTRATDTSFEEGDIIGLYAVKRNGNSIGTMQASGNFADNKRYVFHAGRFTPVATQDHIYPPVGEKVDFYAYYPYQSTPNPMDLNLDSSPGQAIGSNYKASDHLWAKSENGYTNSATPISLPFVHIQGLVEVAVTKNGVDVIKGARIATAATRQNGQLQSGTRHISDPAQTTVTMLLYQETASQYLFRALIPEGNVFRSGQDAFFFALSSGGEKKFVANSELSVKSGKVTRFDLTFPADVITWEYELTVTPLFLSFSSKGGMKNFTVTSTRRKVVNGTPTSTVENVTYTSNVTGPNATGFTVSGNTVIASENPTTDFRDATVTINQANGGKSAAITLEQERKVDIDTEI